MRRDQLSPGTLLGGDYAIEESLAEGGMGVVYTCRQRSTGERRAVKVLSLEVLVDSDLQRRFALECQVGSRIRSEHVVKVLAAGVEGGRTPWIAMELLEGETLTQRVERDGALDLGTVRALFAQLGHALTAAHAVQIAHRDLKPDNVFIARSHRADVAFTVKLLDFGIAKVRDALTPGTTQFAFGTPFWMAPEQFTPGAAWQSADLWALGLLAYYALTGRVYWLGAHDPSQGVAEMFGPTYVSASQRARAQLGRDPLPPGFDDWFARCVALRPEDRFAHIGAALTAWDTLSAASFAPTQPLPRAPIPVIPPTQPTAVARTAPMRTVPSTPPPAPVVPTHAPTERLPSPRRPALLRTVAPWVVALTLAVGAGAGAGWIWFHRDTAAPPSTELPMPPPADPPPTPEVRRAGECLPGMVWIQGARVRMNSSVELDVAGFCIDRHEATVRDYAACVDAGGCVPITRMLGVRTLGNVCNARISGREDHPINCMTFDEAARYCAWRGARLPRSSEWELAAEGSPARSYPWGEALPDATRLNACGLESPERDRYAQTYLEQDAWPTTAPVGSFPGGATPEGVHDLLGNACEWVQDDRPRSDRTQLLRGSGFLDRPELSTQALLARPPGYEGRSNGVRCAR